MQDDGSKMVKKPMLDLNVESELYRGTDCRNDRKERKDGIGYKVLK